MASAFVRSLSWGAGGRHFQGFTQPVRTHTHTHTPTHTPTHSARQRREDSEFGESPSQSASQSPSQSPSQSVSQSLTRSLTHSLTHSLFVVSCPVLSLTRCSPFTPSLTHSLNAHSLVTVHCHTRDAREALPANQRHAAPDWVVGWLGVVVWGGICESFISINTLEGSPPTNSKGESEGGSGREREREKGSERRREGVICQRAGG